MVRSVILAEIQEGSETERHAVQVTSERAVRDRGDCKPIGCWEEKAAAPGSNGPRGVGLLCGPGFQQPVSWEKTARRAPARGRRQGLRRAGGPQLTWESAENNADAIAWSLGAPSR